MAKAAEKMKAIKRRLGILRTNSLIGAIDGVPSKHKQIRGFVAEDKALKVAKYWQKKKIILAVRKTKGLSVEDMGMVDLVLTLRNKQELLIQVKDYCSLEAVRKCRERGVFFFFIGPEEDEEIAKGRMLILIISAYITELNPFQIRQAVDYILEIKGLPQPGLIKRIFSKLGRVFF